MLQNIVKSAVNNYYRTQNGGGQQMGDVDMLVVLITLLLVTFLLAFFGKYLWNEILVKVVTVCKPIDSWVDLLGLVILFNILFCR
jgi:hypothetical protein